MRPNRIAAALLVALLAAGCRLVPVETDYDAEADFAGLRTFEWIDPPLREVPGGEGGDPFARNTLLDKRVREAVEAELEARGYRPAGDGDAPDFLVRYQVVSRQVTRDRPVFVGGGYGHHRHPYGVGTGIVYGGSESYQEGTLILDVIDPENEAITWRGWAAAHTRDGYFDSARIDRYVRAILERFPPGGASPPAEPKPDA